MLDPGAFAGLQVASDAWLTFQFESYFAPYQAVSLGGFVITPSHAAVFDGFALTSTVECRVGRGILYYGLGLYHTTSNYPLWINVEYSPTMITYGSAFAGYEF
jgi:hypothetical protein